MIIGHSQQRYMCQVIANQENAMNKFVKWTLIQTYIVKINFSFFKTFGPNNTLNQQIFIEHLSNVKPWTRSPGTTDERSVVPPQTHHSPLRKTSDMCYNTDMLKVPEKIQQLN